MTLIEVLCKGSMKAMTLHLQEPKFNMLNKHPNRNELVVGCLRQILKQALQPFVEELKEAVESDVSGAWLRKVINTQCNKWALEALQIVAEEI